EQVWREVSLPLFELRRVLLGPACGEQIAILSGVQAGEQVATRGNFLIDSQMQLAGKPSLIDPRKAHFDSRSESPEIESEERIAALSALDVNDRLLAAEQRICPVTKMPLGSMGVPVKVDVRGRTIFICCEGCRKRLLADPAKYVAELSKEVTR
ncbi:MAG: hypothetical protein JJ992_20805, partial [Planctomycetes bacterium]|nr:hypothetical protein [Planctomycetota bacterium]